MVEGLARDTDFGTAPKGQLSLPDAWDSSWSGKSPAVRARIKQLKAGAESLAAGVRVVDRSDDLELMVGSAQLREYPVHRWYFYKEGFSPELPAAVIAQLGCGSGLVVDSFAGVGTTPLALGRADQVKRAVGVEYSPFASWVARVKLRSTGLNPALLRAHVVRLERTLRRARRTLPVPELSTFRNEEIFVPERLQELLRARAALADAKYLDADERDFFRLGLAAVIEGASNAMKDGRALRVLRGRKRTRHLLRPTEGARESGSVNDLLVNQWLAMIEDIEQTPDGATSVATSAQGDARELDRVLATVLGRDPKGTVGLHLYSPPYLNCLDYSEVYKLELWLLGFVSSAAEFRTLREGTLRSHPSIDFPPRPHEEWADAPVFTFIDELTSFLEQHLPRRPVGTMVGQYFRDMYQVLRQQVDTLEPGGHIACVVANSTFAGRMRTDGNTLSEIWRLPVLTDLLVARLAEAAGAQPVAIWQARSLRPRNARSGSARESVVVCRKTTP